MRFAVFVPVGPDARELERLHAVTESLQAGIGSTGALVVVDDGPEPRDLLSHVAWTPDETVVLKLPPADATAHKNDRIAVAILTFARWLAAAPYDYGLKLDTDALVIGDFRPGLAGAFAQAATGMCGACERNTVGGELRDLTLWRRQLLHACSPVQLRVGGGRPRIILGLSGHRARQRRFVTRALRSARRHGYRLGEHCLGGSYALSSAAARALQAEGLLDDPAITAGSGLAEDVVLALLVRAAGFRLQSLVAPGEPFALQHIGLLDTPEALVAARHAIVHSVKSDDPELERQLIASFARLRPGIVDQDPGVA